MGELTLTDDADRELVVAYGDRELLRYVYRPDEAQLESPRPYFHPVRTLGGDVVTDYRPADHVWHKGIALSLPNVGPANFWGGRTYVRDAGYQQLPNNGAMRHVRFEHGSAGDGRVDVEQALEWITEQGQRWFTERRRFSVTVDDDSWTLAFTTAFTNVSGQQIAIGSPTTEGRPNAGYGGLFWRGPDSFVGGRVYVPDGAGGDELMGVRAPWLAFCGNEQSATLVFVDDPANVGHPTTWFVRSTPYACLCPAPFFDTERPVAPGDTMTLRYAIAIAAHDTEVAGAQALATNAANVTFGSSAAADATSAANGTEESA